MTAKYVILATALCFVVVLAQSPEEIAEKQKAEFKAQCETNGGDFDKAVNASKVFKECLQYDVIVDELEGAKKDKRKMTNVVTEYCSSSSYQACLESFSYHTLECYAEEDRKHVRKVNELVKNLIDFMCVKEKEGFASFLSGGVYDCFQNRSEELKQCWSKTLGSNKGIIDIVYNVHFAFDEIQCNQSLELQKCVVDELKNCTKPDFVDLVFNYLKKEATPCKEFLVRRVTTTTTTTTTTEKSTTTSEKSTTTSEKSTTTTQKNETTGNNARNETGTQQNPAAQTGSASGLAVTAVTIIMAVATAILL